MKIAFGTQKLGKDEPFFVWRKRNGIVYWRFGFVNRNRFLGVVGVEEDTRTAVGVRQA